MRVSSWQDGKGILKRSGGSLRRIIDSRTIVSSMLFTRPYFVFRVTMSTWSLQSIFILILRRHLSEQVTSETIRRRWRLGCLVIMRFGVISCSCAGRKEKVLSKRRKMRTGPIPRLMSSRMQTGNYSTIIIMMENVYHRTLARPSGSAGRLPRVCLVSRAKGLY
jgi:hypothetical protein